MTPEQGNKVGAQHGVRVARAMFERDGDALLRAVADFVRGESVTVSECVLAELRSAIRDVESVRV